MASAIASTSVRSRAPGPGPKLKVTSDPSIRIRQAVRDNNVALLQRLQHKYDLRNTDRGRLTSLSWAAVEGSLEVFEWLLLDYGHDDSELSRDGDHNTILHILATIPSPTGTPPTINPRYNTQPPKTTSRPPEEASAIALRMTHLYITLFPFLLDWSNGGGKTPLHLAAQAGNGSFIALLCDFEADVDLTDLQGNTPLHYAAAWGHMDAIKVLLERGCQWASRNFDGFTPSDFAFSDSVKDGLMSMAKEVFEERRIRKREERRAEKEAARLAELERGSDGGISPGVEGLGGDNRHRSESVSTSNSMGRYSDKSGKSAGSSQVFFDASNMPPPPSLPAYFDRYPRIGSAQNTPPMSRSGSEGVATSLAQQALPVDIRSQPVSRASPALPQRSDSLPGMTPRPSMDGSRPPSNVDLTNQNFVPSRGSTLGPAPNRPPLLEDISPHNSGRHVPMTGPKMRRTSSAQPGPVPQNIRDGLNMRRGNTGTGRD